MHKTNPDTGVTRWNSVTRLSELDAIDSRNSCQPGKNMTFQFNPIHTARGAPKPCKRLDPSASHRIQQKGQPTREYAQYLTCKCHGRHDDVFVAGSVIVRLPAPKYAADSNHIL